MKEVKFNQGHEVKLEQLGVFTRGESALSPEELTRRSRETQSLSEVIEVVEMELANLAVRVQLIEFSMIKIEELLADFQASDLPELVNELRHLIYMHLEAISQPESLLQSFEMLRVEAIKSKRPRRFTRILQYYLTLSLKIFRDKRNRRDALDEMTFSAKTLYYVQKIPSDIQVLDEIIAGKREKIDELSQIITEKMSDLKG